MVFCVLFVTMESTNSHNISMVISLFVLFVIGCILAVYFFVSNLSKLIQSQVTPASTSKMVRTSDDIKLDDQQQKLSNLSSKYTMLFGFAIMSTILLILVT